MTLRQRIPNLLTFARVLAVPACLWLIYVARGEALQLFWIFIAASLTDFLDGYLARKWHATSALGTFLDPVADKLLVALMLVYLLTRFPTLLLPVIVILLREIYISALREFLAAKGASLPVSRGGKLKTALQMIAVTLLLGHLAYNPPGALRFPCSIVRTMKGVSEADCSSQPWLLQFAEKAGQPMLIAAAIVALLTALHYTYAARKSLR